MQPQNMHGIFIGQQVVKPKSDSLLKNLQSNLSEVSCPQWPVIRDWECIQKCRADFLSTVYFRWGLTRILELTNDLIHGVLLYACSQYLRVMAGHWGQETSNKFDCEFCSTESDFGLTTCSDSMYKSTQLLIILHTVLNNVSNMQNWIQTESLHAIIVFALVRHLGVTVCLLLLNDIVQMGINPTFSCSSPEGPGTTGTGGQMARHTTRE